MMIINDVNGFKLLINILYDEVINEFLTENNQLKILSLINWNELFQTINNGSLILIVKKNIYYNSF